MTKTIKTKNYKIEGNYSEGEDKVIIKLVGHFTFAIVGEFRQAYESQPTACQYIQEKNQDAKLYILNASRNIQKVLDCAKITDIAKGIQFQHS